MKRIPAILLSLPFLALSFFALRLAWADFLFRTGKKEDISRAAVLVPSRAEYQAALGNFRRAVELNPYFTAAWLDWAAEEEGKGNIDQAERCLLEAAKNDATFAPRWALSNFYFRLDRQPEFWRWMRLAAERSYGDREALFQLAWRSGLDGAQIEKRLAAGLSEVLGPYVRWLLKLKKFPEVAAAGAALSVCGSKQDTDLLLTASNVLVEQAYVAGAREIWNGMAAKGWIGGGTLETVAIANAQFQWRPTGKAFDWRLPWRAGVEHQWRPGQLTIRLDGREEPNTDLLVQYVLTEPRQSYELRYRYQSEGLARKSGIRWRVYEGDQQIAGSEFLTGTEWQAGRLLFGPARNRAVRLVLQYEREPGTVRPEGWLALEGNFALAQVAATGRR